MNNQIQIPKTFWLFIGSASLLFISVCNPFVIGKLFCDDGQIGSKILYNVILVLDLLGLATLAIALLLFKKSITISKNLLFSIIMSLGTLVILLSISEIFLRFIHPYQAAKYINIGDKVFPLYGHSMPKHFTFDPVTGYALIPNIHDLNQKINTDPNGFRITSRKYSPEKQSIVFVGDSTVFGWGVQDEATFPYLLSQRKEFEQFNFINMGVPSYSIGHICAVLKNKVPALHPKIVFVAILWPWKPFLSYSKPDAWRTIDFDFYRETIPLRQNFQSEEKSFMRWIPKTLLVLKDSLMRISYNRQIKENLTRPGIRDFTLSPDEEKKLASIHAEELSRAVEFLKSSGTQVIFYIHPYQYTIFDEAYKDLGKVGRELISESLHAYYPGEFLKSHYQHDPLFIDGCHLTEKGNQVFAEYLADILKLLKNKNLL